MGLILKRKKIIRQSMGLTTAKRIQSFGWPHILVLKVRKKAASELARIPLLNLETYVATQTLIRQWSDRKKKVESVVIPMIIFAEVSTEEEILAVKKYPLILKVLTLPGQKDPAHIPSKQIEQLKFMLNESEEPVEFVQEVFRLHDKVEIIRGNLKGLVGSIERTSNSKVGFMICLDFLGGAKLEIDINNLKLI